MLPTRDCESDEGSAIPVLHRRALNGPSMSVSRVLYDGRAFGFAPILPRDDAYFMSVKLRPMSSGRMWLGNRAVTNPQVPVRLHAICFAHLSDEPHCELFEPFDIVRFNLPRFALKQVIDDSGARQIEELRCPTPGTVDPIIGHLAACLLPALEQPDGACPLFIDAITRSITTHLLRTYGSVKLGDAPSRRGGLASWQEKRVRELIDTHLDGSLTVPMLANECGMSVGHFSHAFKQQTGQSPYQFLIAQRLLRAKALMLTTQLSLAEIALACGFAAQAHFNRRFLTSNGMSPGAWRRAAR
ncbi:helix-turn-helix domain-containing protein [Paraburkholderia sp. GAS334]|uniref:helix-turn-helix domain-containing protein n=1 Tax=Paraburkholderia sp. GAS334 TaxID=3035131 RepID=UPI003D2564D5